MTDMKSAVKQFFDSFEMESDKKNGHFYKGYLTAVINDFLEKEDKENAFMVYTTFFDCYRIKIQGNKSFIDLLDLLKSYEENASTLLDRQRDHYVHSVNVFILGIYIFINNNSFREIFHNKHNNEKYEGKLEDYTEEFLFRWGVAAFFHDIGYPIEITNNQLNKFIKFIAETNSEGDPKPYIGFGDFSYLNSISSLTNDNKEILTLDNEVVNALDPLELLAYNLHKSFDIPFQQINNTLSNFIKVMQEKGFVDHGFYSAIVVLRWYGSLIEQNNIDEDILYYPILDSAASILLHNFYKNVLQKEPYNMPELKANSHPIAYMLILCDELQEWNREAYGILDKQKVLVAESDVQVTNEEMKIHFITYENTLSEDFAIKKEEMFKKLLNLSDLFPSCFKITTTSKSDIYIDSIKNRESYLLPRPFLENIEEMAKKIHHNYNLQQLAKDPNKIIEYPNWETLPDTLKYSNIRQARGYFDKLKLLGMYASTNSDREQVLSFTDEQIEALAREEHDSWYEERKQNGWKFGQEKDVENKLSPYMIPYDELSEEIKELDRDAVKNIFPLLHEIGLKVYRINN